VPETGEKEMSKIEWTEMTWNCITGCTKVSDECAACYAEPMSSRCAAMGHEKYVGVTVNNGGGVRWTNVVRCHPDMLDANVAPLKRKKPTMIFVNSMSDTFHKEVPTEFILRMFDIMRQSPQHTFQLLTKRPERVSKMNAAIDWPDNVWMGTSVGNACALHRVDLLRKCDAKVKWLSLEPLIGSLAGLDVTGIDWVVVGGESGRGGRPMQKEWVDEIRDKCDAHSVPFFFKQWGKLRNNPDKGDGSAKANGGESKGGRMLDGQVVQRFPLR
jgi:protein gp37